MAVVDMSIAGGARLEGGEREIVVGDMEALGVTQRGSASAVMILLCINEQPIGSRVFPENPSVLKV
jgi:hypothetical protein